MNSAVWQRRYQDSVTCSNLDHHHHHNAVDFSENMSLLGCCNCNSNCNQQPPPPPWQPSDVFVGLPPGTRFMPTDVELLENYMDVEKAKLYPSTFHFLDVYKYNPCHLADLYPQHASEKRWYFITPTEKKYPKGKVAKRSACGGYWKASAAEEQIKNEQGAVIGKKKTLVFFAFDHNRCDSDAAAAGKESKKRPNGVKTNWHMHEYLVARTVISGDMNKLNDNVLCKIYLSNRKRKADSSPAQGQYANARVTDFKVEEHHHMPEDHHSNQTQTAAAGYHHHHHHPITATTQCYPSSSYSETTPMLFRSNSSVSTITTSDDEFQPKPANANANYQQYGLYPFQAQDYDIHSHQPAAGILFENKLANFPCYTTTTVATADQFNQSSSGGTGSGSLQHPPMLFLQSSSHSHREEVSTTSSDIDELQQFCASAMKTSKYSSDPDTSDCFDDDDLLAFY